MSGNYMFVMVAQGDTPIYEAEFLNTQRVRSNRNAHPHTHTRPGLSAVPCGCTA